MIKLGKIKKLFFLALISFIFSLPKLTLAQSVTSSQGWFCAKVTYCADKKDYKYQEGTCTLKSGHRVRLEVESGNRPLANNNETYLVECLSSINNGAPDFRCTTGSSNLDIKAFGVDNYTWLKNTWGYSLERDANYGIFAVINNQAVKIGSKEYKTGPSGGLIIKESNEAVSVFEWQSYIPEGKNHKFYFFQKIPLLPTVEPGQGGQQQATSFDWVNADQDCAVIRWDPAGRVFDAISLEPVPGAAVFLTKDDGEGSFVNAAQFELGIINPQLTNPQGGFSFYVSDGNYKLSINNLRNLDYERIASSLTEINSKYDRIYYHLGSGRKLTFIYPAETGEIIKQKGKIEYRDLPLISADGQGKYYPLKVISAFYSVDRFSGKVIFEGNVSHPFAQVIIYGINKKQRDKIIYQGVTDNYGNYKIVFDQDPKGVVYDSFEVDFLKTNLSNVAKNNLIRKIVSWFFNKITIFAQTTTNKVTVRLDPIPTYLEGIAQDQSGKVLANSQVKVYIKGMNVPYTVVNTDSQGYFKVPSHQLPSFSYEIKYQDSSGKIIPVSISQFIADNRGLLTSKKINLYSLKDNQGKAIRVTPKSGNLFVSPGKDLTSVGNKTRTDQVPPTQAKKNQQPIFSNGVVLILATIFFLLIIIGVIIYFYWRQKQSSLQI